MDDEERRNSTGANDHKTTVDEGSRTPPEFSNSPGTSRGECDIEEHAGQDTECDFEVTAQVQDFVLEETKPGVGIEGFEGEEVGGG